MDKIAFSLITGLFFFVINEAIDVSPNQIHWTRDLTVGNGYHIRWNNEDPEYLVMEISAPVKGYVAVGFSPNGGMKGSDIMMGWVDSVEGTAFIKVAGHFLLYLISHWVCVLHYHNCF